MQFLTQPVDKNLVVGEAYTVNIGVTGEVPTPEVFVNKALPSNTLEVCYGILSDSSGNIFAHAGTTASTDSKLFKSTDGADNWTTVYTDSTTNSIGVQSAIVTTGGVVVSAVANSSASTVKIYKDGVFSTSLSITGPATNALAMHIFPNGNIIVGVGGSGTATGSGYVYLSTDNAVTFSRVLTTVVGTSYRINSFCEVNATTVVATDILGYVYRTVDSGISWSQVGTIGTDVGVYPIGLLGSRLIAWNQITNVWKQSTDNGTTWVDYVGTPPPFGAYYKIRLFGSITIFGEYNGNRITMNDNDTGWVTYSLPDSGVTQVNDVLMLNGYIYVCTGTTTGWGRVYKTVLNTLFNFYKTPNILIDSKRDTDGTYTFSDTADASDVGNYYATATNAGVTIQSNTFAIAVASTIVVEAYSINTLTPPVQSTITVSMSVSGTDSAYTYFEVRSGDRAEYLIKKSVYGSLTYSYDLPATLDLSGRLWIFAKNDSGQEVGRQFVDFNVLVSNSVITPVATAFSISSPVDIYPACAMPPVSAIDMSSQTVSVSSMRFLTSPADQTAVSDSLTDLSCSVTGGVVINHVDLDAFTITSDTSATIQDGDSVHYEFNTLTQDVYATTRSAVRAERLDTFDLKFKYVSTIHEKKVRLFAEGVKVLEVTIVKYTPYPTYIYVDGIYHGSFENGSFPTGDGWNRIQFIRTGGSVRLVLSGTIANTNIDGIYTTFYDQTFEMSSDLTNWYFEIGVLDGYAGYVGSFAQLYFQNGFDSQFISSDAPYVATLTKLPSTVLTTINNTTGLFAYSIPSAQVVDSGDYQWSVSNAGLTLYDDSLLTVFQALQFDSQPVDQSVDIGQNIDLSVSYSGGRDGLPVSATLYHLPSTAIYSNVNATSLILFQIADVQEIQSGAYQWVITNGEETITGNVVNVDVIDPYVQISINYDPTLVSILSGSTIELTCNASGGTGIFQKTLIDVTTSTILSTTSPVLITIMDNYDGHNWQWEVTDGITTKYSELISVSVNHIISINPSTFTNIVLEEGSEFAEIRHVDLDGNTLLSTIQSSLLLDINKFKYNFYNISTTEQGQHIQCDCNIEWYHDNVLQETWNILNKRYSWTLGEQLLIDINDSYCVSARLLDLIIKRK